MYTCILGAYTYRVVSAVTEVPAISPLLKDLKFNLLHTQPHMGDMTMGAMLQQLQTLTALTTPCPGAYERIDYHE